MREESINLYAETYTIHLFLPEYVNECGIKQLRKVIKIMNGDAWAGYEKTKSELKAMREAVDYCLTIASTATRIRKLNTKRQIIERALEDLYDY